MNKSIDKLAKIFKEKNAELYLVGGAVRDIVLEQIPHDYDFATNLIPEQTKELLAKNNIFYTNVGEQYGTIVAHIDGEEYEITTYRKDKDYEDGRHPSEITYASNIVEDLSRRDFTMNAMAKDMFSGEIIDPFNGQEDLKRKQLRFVGDAQQRIEEDALRILRAIRFAIKYDLSIDSKTEGLLKENAPTLSNVSWERKGQELAKILECNKPISKVFKAMPEVVYEIIPELKPCFYCSQVNPYHKHNVYDHILEVVDASDTNKFEIKMAALLHDIGKPVVKTIGDDLYEHFKGHPVESKRIAEDVLKRLKYPKKVSNYIETLVEIHDINFFQTEKQLNRAIYNYGEDIMKDLVILQKADLSDHIIPPDMSEQKKAAWFTSQEKIEEMFKNIKSKHNTLTTKGLALNGYDFMQMGYVGAEIGEIQRYLLDAVLDEKVDNMREDLIAFLLSEREEEIDR